MIFRLDGTVIGGAGPTTPTSVGPKILPFMVKALCFESFGRTNNCQTDALFRWSDQSCTPSAASEIIGGYRYFVCVITHGDVVIPGVVIIIRLLVSILENSVQY